MAKTKIPFSKFGFKRLEQVRTINFVGQEIEVKQYLPIEEKLQLISNVINLAAYGNNFMNPVKTEAFTILEIIFNYTNITFTDKQKEDLGKLYDLVVENGLAIEVINAIPKEEYEEVYSGVMECSKSLYAQINSAKSIFESIIADFDATNLEASEIQQKLADPKNMKFLKEVLDKMG